MGRYRISKRAIEDLNGIWDYTVAVWSEAQAVKYYNQIYNSIENLSENPGYKGLRYDFIKEGLWGYRVGHHIIFYKILSENYISVDRILHERMDYQRHL